MDFDFGAAAANFPRMETEFRDDDAKLHSDLVGISVDVAAHGEKEEGDEDEFGMWSLQLEDPRKSTKQKRGENNKQQVVEY